MGKDYRKIATNILSNIGGAINVDNSMNCMTRLRISVKNPKQVNEEELKKVEGVMQLIVDKKIMQIVLGPGVAQKVATEFNSLLKNNATSATAPESKDKLNINDDWKENKSKIKEKQKRFGWLNRGMRHLANIFTPLIPAIIAAGLFAALASIVSQFGANGTISTASNPVKAFYYIFTIFSKGFTTYLTLACGYNAAKEFGATPMLGLMLGGICIVPEVTELAKLIGLADSEGSLSSVLLAGKGGVIGVIIACLLLSFVEKFLHKRMPNAVDTVLTPFISILLVGAVYVFGIMIVTGYIADGIAWLIQQMTMNEHVIVRIIVGFIAAALFLPLVMMGMHHGLVAIYSVEFQKLGFVTLYPALAMAGAGQVGAAVALYLKARRMKNNQLQRNIVGSIVPGICGVGEPLIYSVTLPLGLPFLTAGLGAGLGGAFVMAFRVASTTWGPSGVIAIPLMTYVNGEPNALLGFGLYTAGLLISAIGGFLFTWFFIKEKKVAPKAENAQA